MALIGEMQYLTIGDSTYSVPTGGGGGTVTSVRVQATSPVQSSNSAAQSAILNTTISLANGYGDTKNPYASKSKNLVLASPTSASGVPSFRALDASDIPDLSGDYLPANTSIPSKTSDLTNDSGFITGYTETDPTVPSWAKASTKPSYTASEVGAVPTSRTVNGKALSSNITLSASDVGALPSSTTIPSKTSDITNDSGFTTLDLVYPVGSIYMSVNNTNPSTLFGGTWQQIQDTFLLSAGSTYTAGDTGGEATHKLTAAETGVAQHTHGFTQPTVNGGAVTNGITGGGHVHELPRGTRNNSGTTTGYGYRTESGAVIDESVVTKTHTHNLPSHTHTVSGGAVGDTTTASATNAHNNMPPYLVVYMWKRTA